MKLELTYSQLMVLDRQVNVAYVYWSDELAACSALGYGPGSAKYERAFLARTENEMLSALLGEAISETRRN